MAELIVPPFAMLPGSVCPVPRLIPSVAPPETLIGEEVMFPLTAFPICSVPAVTFVAPVYEFALFVSVVVPAPLCVSESVPAAFERMPESVMAVAEFTTTLPAPPSVLPMLFENVGAMRFTSVSTPPVPTFTAAVPAASMRLAEPPVPMVSPPALTVALLSTFAPFVSVVVPAPVCVSASAFAPAVIAPASVSAVAEFAFTVPVAPSELVMLLFSVPPLTFTSAIVPPLPTLIVFATTFDPARLAFSAVPICSVPAFTIVVPV